MGINRAVGFSQDDTPDRFARRDLMYFERATHQDGMKVGYVCTNYNNSRFTREAVESLLAAQGAARVRVVIVDNRSSDDDVAALTAIAREHPAVEVVLSDRNVGYFPGLNLGLRRLRELHPDIRHVVVGNNDLVFPADFLDRLEQHADVFEQWAVVAPDLVSGEHHQNPHVLHPISRARRLVWDAYYRWYALAYVIRLFAEVTRPFTSRRETRVGHGLHDQPRPIILGLGACYLLGPKFFQHFDLLYAPTFLMGEEFFLAEQVKTIDQSVYYDPRFVVHHHGAATTNEVPSRRLWTLSRDSHHVYKQFLGLSVSEQRDRIMRASRLSA